MQNLSSAASSPAPLFRYTFTNEQLELLKAQIQRYKVLNAQMEASFKEKQREIDAMNRARAQAAIAAQAKARSELQEAEQAKAADASAAALHALKKAQTANSLQVIPLNKLVAMSSNSEYVNQPTQHADISKAAIPCISREWQQVQHGLFFEKPFGSMSTEPFPIFDFDVGVVMRQDQQVPILDGLQVARQIQEGAVCSVSQAINNLNSELTLERKELNQEGHINQVKQDMLFLRTSMMQQSFRQQIQDEMGNDIRSQSTRKAFLLDPSSAIRTRRHVRREGRTYEKDEARRLAEQAELKKRKYQGYIKAVLSHREDFLKFHRQRRAEGARAAKAVKSYVEQISLRAEREGDKAEKKRLAALRANDMDAYSKLVEETKNERLKYLLAQTDRYIQDITVKINQQRQLLEQDSSMLIEENESGYHEHHSNFTDSATAGSSAEEGAQNRENYFKNAHNKIEEVRQPTMLRGGELKEYQVQGLQWMVSLYNNNLNGILADEMGLGKTIQTIALLAYIMEVKRNHGPFLVVVPLSTLSNWVVEFMKWAPDIITVVYKGTPQTRKDIFTAEMESGQYNVLITTYEYIMKDKAVLRKPFWQYIIVDEGHRMKNAQSKFAQTLGSAYQSRSRLLLTGTPLQNSLPELWALLNFLLPTIFNSVDTFDQWFNQPFASFRGGGASIGVGSQGGASEAQELLEISAEERMLVINRLHELLRPFMLRRVKASVMGQLPDKVEKVLRCELSGWQKFLYKQIQTEGAVAINPASDGGTAGGRGLSNIFMQLRKVCNHPYLFFSDTWPTNLDLVRSSGKFELLDRMLPKLKAQGHRILMFSQMTQAMDILEDFFFFRGYRYLRLDGSTSAEEREQRTDQFNAPDSPFFIFILSTRAGGLGLNLATADTVIIFDSDWNPMMDAQAQDRAHRIGQKNEVRVFRLITCSPIEERILSRASDKLNNIGLVVEAGKFNKDSKASERRQMLEALLREMDDQDGAQSEDNGVPDDDQINAMMAHTQEELEAYTEMDKEREAQEEQWAADAGLRRWKRLMAANERPAWLDRGSAPPAEPTPEKQVQKATSSTGTPEEAGRAGRKVKRIDYRDSMTDVQFDRMVAKGMVPLPRAAPQSKGERGGKGKKRPSNMREDLVGAKRGKGSRGSSTVTTQQSKLSDAVLAQLSSISLDMRDARASDGHLLMEYFMVKPRKNEFAGYYDIIKRPMDYKTINARLKSRYYRSISDFEDDWMLIFNNARIYNTDDSIVFQDACTLEERLRVLMLDLRQWCNSEPPEVIDSQLALHSTTAPRQIELRERRNSYLDNCSSWEDDNEEEYTEPRRAGLKRVGYLSPASSADSFKPKGKRRGR